MYFVSDKNFLPTKISLEVLYSLPLKIIDDGAPLLSLIDTSLKYPVI